MATSDWGPTYSYTVANGRLFNGTPSYADIRQGGLGDCYLLSSLGETALRTPAVIQNMFIVNGDGTYTVRFYHNGVADYVTVDSALPVDQYGRLVFNGNGALAKGRPTCCGPTWPKRPTCNCPSKAGRAPTKGAAA